MDRKPDHSRQDFQKQTFPVFTEMSHSMCCTRSQYASDAQNNAIYMKIQKENSIWTDASFLHFIYLNLLSTVIPGELSSNESSISPKSLSFFFSPNIVDIHKNIFVQLTIYSQTINTSPTVAFLVTVISPGTTINFT